MVGVGWFLADLGEERQLFQDAAFIQYLLWSGITEKLLDPLGR